MKDIIIDNKEDLPKNVYNPTVIEELPDYKKQLVREFHNKESKHGERD